MAREVGNRELVVRRARAMTDRVETGAGSAIGNLRRTVVKTSASRLILPLRRANNVLSTNISRRVEIHTSDPLTLTHAPVAIHPIFPGEL